MSLNWVMLDPKSPTAFAPLPSEQTLYTSPPRTSLSLQSISKYPASQPFQLASSTGTLHLTNRRLIYLPTTSTPALQSFACPILNIYDSHITTPWIGPNAWTAVVRPVQGGGIPAQHAAGVEVKLTFKDGGAYDFQTRYERVRERLQQALETARESGTAPGAWESGRGGGGGGAYEGINVDGVHLEELPRYEEASGGGAVPVPVMGQSVTEQTGPTHERDERPVRRRAEDVDGQNRGVVGGPPVEPPPSYEDLQREVVEDELSRRMNGTRIPDEG